MIEMVLIPGGTFTMGSPETEPGRRQNEGPQHSVTVPHFFMGRYPVTQAQWRTVAGYKRVNQDLEPDPSRFKGDNRPVEKVTWYDAVEFCNRLSQRTSRLYHLPSEAEWEYACRAGTTTPFHFGDTIHPDIANYRCSETYENSPRGEYRQETTSVDYFGTANAFGLCDMHGNVWEWCQDQYHNSYDEAPTDGTAWIDNNENDNRSRILRGGSWINHPGYCRAAYRNLNFPRNRYSSNGLRLSCQSPEDSLALCTIVLLYSALCPFHFFPRALRDQFFCNIHRYVSSSIQERGSIVVIMSAPG